MFAEHKFSLFLKRQNSTKEKSTRTSNSLATLFRDFAKPTTSSQETLKQRFNSAFRKSEHIPSSTAIKIFSLNDTEVSALTACFEPPKPNTPPKKQQELLNSSISNRTMQYTVDDNHNTNIDITRSLQDFRAPDEIKLFQLKASENLIAVLSEELKKQGIGDDNDIGLLAHFLSEKINQSNVVTIASKQIKQFLFSCCNIFNGKSSKQDNTLVRFKSKDNKTLMLQEYTEMAKPSNFETSVDYMPVKNDNASIVIETLSELELHQGEIRFKLIQANLFLNPATDPSLIKHISEIIFPENDVKSPTTEYKGALVIIRKAILKQHDHAKMLEEIDDLVRRGNLKGMILAKGKEDIGKRLVENTAAIRTLKKLDLSENQLKNLDFIDIICNLKGSESGLYSFNEMDLSHNQLTGEDVIFLLNTLQAPQLETLNLSSNRITDIDAEAIIRYIEKNHILIKKDLILTNNPISTEVVAKLNSCLKESRTKCDAILAKADKNDEISEKDLPQTYLLATNNEGNSLLHLAILRANKPLVELILKKSGEHHLAAIEKIKNAKGETIINLAANSSNKEIRSIIQTCFSKSFHEQAREAEDLISKLKFS